MQPSATAEAGVPRESCRGVQRGGRDEQLFAPERRDLWDLRGEDGGQVVGINRNRYSILDLVPPEHSTGEF